MKVIKLLRKNLRKLLKLIMFYLTPNVNKTTIILDTRHLKMVEVEEEVSATLTFLIISQIFLKIFLEKDLVEAVEEAEEQITEDQI